MEQSDLGRNGRNLLDAPWCWYIYLHDWSFTYIEHMGIGTNGYINTLAVFWINLDLLVEIYERNPYKSGYYMATVFRIYLHDDNGINHSPP